MKKSVPPLVAKQIFVAAYKVFCKYRPGDSESMIQQETDSAQMFKQVCLSLKHVLRGSYSMNL